MVQAARIRELYEALEGSLGLAWMAGQAGADRLLRLQDRRAVDPALSGLFDHEHPCRVPIFGTTELQRVEQGFGWPGLLGQFLSNPPAAIILADGVTAATDLVIHAEDHGIPLFGSAHPAHDIHQAVTRWAHGRLGARVVEHGVFLDVFGVGVLVTGGAGVGKSEVALELINRGHRLIADDAPEFVRADDGVLIGSCPLLLQDFLEVRGLGLLNVRRMYGDGAIKLRKPLELMVHLKWMDGAELQQLDRLRWQHNICELLGVAVDVITLPVTPGRELGILVETSVRLYRQRRQGYDSSEEFIQRQAAAIREPGTP